VKQLSVFFNAYFCAVSSFGISVTHSAIQKMNIIFLRGEGPRSRCYGRTTALRLFVQPCDEDEQILPSFTSNGAPVE
jgi:hypothetical protein